MAILVTSADSERVQHLLRIRLMSFAAEEDAYTNRLPALSKLVLREIGTRATNRATQTRDECNPRVVAVT